MTNPENGSGFSQGSGEGPEVLSDYFLYPSGGLHVWSRLFSLLGRRRLAQADFPAQINTGSTSAQGLGHDEESR